MPLPPAPTYTCADPVLDTSTGVPLRVIHIHKRGDRVARLQRSATAPAARGWTLYREGLPDPLGTFPSPASAVAWLARVNA